MLFFFGKQFREFIIIAESFKLRIHARDAMNCRSQPKDENGLSNEFTLLQLLFSRQVY